MERDVAVLKVKPGVLIEDAPVEVLKAGLEPLQQFVEGGIDILAIDENNEYEVVVNDDDKNRGLEANCAWIIDGEVGDFFAGNIIIRKRETESFELVDFTESDKEKVAKILKSIIAITNRGFLVMESGGRVQRYPFMS